MDVLVTGGSGFIGRALCARLAAEGHTATVLSRSPKAGSRLPKGVNLLLGDPTIPGPWQKEAANLDGFINLAGASIFNRWTKGYKEQIMSSRVSTTRNLVEAMAQGDPKQRVLVSASAVGYYGDRGDEELDEDSAPGEDFLASVCRNWEAEAGRATELGTRVVITRFGIVLGQGGGALGKMLPLFRLGLGGRLGSGRQWFSWIHREDLIRAVLDCILIPDRRGVYNLTSPNPVTNRELTRALGGVLKRPAVFPAPSWALRLVLGEMASVLLGGQKVLPRRLEQAGFSFAKPGIEEALADLTRPG